MRACLRTTEYILSGLIYFILEFTGLEIESQKVTLGRFDADDGQGETSISVKKTAIEFVMSLMSHKDEVSILTLFKVYSFLYIFRTTPEAVSR